jgi:hypothetical protein
MHNAELLEVRFSHTALRATFAAHSIELKVGCGNALDARWVAYGEKLN